MSDTHGRRGRWIDMLQDCSFKILHRPGLRHTNADALNKNPVGQATDDDDFGEEIQDIGSSPTDTSKREGEALLIQTSEGREWLGDRRKDRECVHQQLYMVDVVSEEDQTKESESYEAEVARRSEIVQGEGVGVMLKRRRPQCYDRQQ
jgi:hypothetical protein